MFVQRDKPYCFLCAADKSYLNTAAIWWMIDRLFIDFRWDIAVDVQSSPFELEITVGVERIEYELYLWSNT